MHTSTRGSVGAPILKVIDNSELYTCPSNNNGITIPKVQSAELRSVLTARFVMTKFQAHTQLARQMRT